MSEAGQSSGVRATAAQLDEGLRRLLPFGVLPTPSSAQSFRGINTQEIARLRRKLGLLDSLLDETNREIALVHPPRSNSQQQRDLILNLLDLAVSKPPSPDDSLLSSPSHPRSQVAVEDSVHMLQQEVRRQSSRIAFLEQRLVQVTASEVTASPVADKLSTDRGPTSPPAWPRCSLALDKASADGKFGACLSSRTDVAGGDAAAGAARNKGLLYSMQPLPLPLPSATPPPLSARYHRPPVVRPPAPSSAAVTPRLARSATTPTVGVERRAASLWQQQLFASASSSGLCIPGDRLGVSAAPIRQSSLERAQRAALPMASSFRSAPSRLMAQRAFGGSARTPPGGEHGNYVPHGFASAASIGLSDRATSASSLSGLVAASSLASEGTLLQSEPHAQTSIASSSTSAGLGVSRQFSAPRAACPGQIMNWRPAVF